MRIKKFSVGFLLSFIIQQSYGAVEELRLGPKDERRVAYNARRQAAWTQTLAHEPQDIETNNGDEQELPDYAGSFSKLLEHNEKDGALTYQGIENYKKLVKAINSGKQSDYNAIARYPGSQRLYVNPQAACALTMNGEDSSLFVIPRAPKLVSAQAAADMIETYLNAICRDVNFSDYGTGHGTDIDPMYGGSLTQHAASILDDLGDAYTGPRNSKGHVDVSVLFRGITSGDLVGPYISQFFLLPFYPLFVSGCVGPTADLIGVPNLPIDESFATKQLYPIASKREFGVSWNDFVALQNGLIPKIYNKYDYERNKRYIINGRDMAAYVHQDGPYQTFYNALNILASRSFSISRVFPYANGSMKNEGSGLTMGPPDAYGLIGGVALTALRAVWAQKWRCDRRLRPEAMAGLVHKAKVTGNNKYNLHNSLFEEHKGYDLLELVRTHNRQQANLPHNAMPYALAGTYLLSQVFPEAAPEHPSYPQGHATEAGSCVTVLKAIFDENAKIISKVVPVKGNPDDPTQLIPLTNAEGANQLTVGGELNKLAFILAMGRDFAGVHYRSDAQNGLFLGEKVAISYLQDHARIYQEDGFTGFELTKFDGTKIRITGDEVIVL